jgi:TPR repeat protein
MLNNYSVFQDNNGLFRKYALAPMTISQEYLGIAQQFDATLLLADRILCAFAEDMDFNQIEKINTYLVDIARAEERQEDNSRTVDALLQASEQWLKPILWLISPASWVKLNQNKKSFTLFPTIRELGLLTQTELDTPEREAYNITDEVRQLIYWNRKDRNYVTHETHEAPAHIRGRFLTVALITLIAPVYKHQDVIRGKLLDLVASPFQNKEIEDLLALVNSERLKHLERFRARDRWIAELQTRLRNDSQLSNPYLLLIGYEGIGKSAICAKLTDVLSAGAARGRYAGGVKKIAPWLPHILLHFGKQSNQPNEIVRSLISQANTLLLRPAPLPEASDYIDPEIETESLEKDIFIQRESKRTNSRARRNDAPLPIILESYKSAQQGHSGRTRHKAATSELIQYRRALYLVLEKVTQERGPIVLIIDAIDEITTSGGELEFLPERLPVGVSALVTGRHNTKAVDWLVSNREVDRVRLAGLDKDEIPLLTQIDSLDGADEANFNDRVLRASQGWPVLVLAAAKSAREQRDNLNAVQVDRSVDSVFARQASEWYTDSPDSPDLLHELLLLLGIFEPVAPLELGLVQSYLDYQNIKLTLAELRQELLPVGAQLEGMSVGRIKLGLKAFAEYVRERYCSKRDIRGVMESIIGWLKTESDIDTKTLSAFLKFWADPDQVRDKNILASVEKLVDSLKDSSTPNYLYKIYLLSQQKRLKKDALLPFASRLLFAAAELGDPSAMFTLGWRLFEGVGINKDDIEGEQWLRRAGAANHASAIVYLATHLLEGDGIEKNSEEGEALLRQAADLGSISGSIILARCLLDGQGVEKNTLEGEQILRRLADNGEQVAIHILAIRLISGLGLAKNLEEGEQLLRKLDEAHYTVATLDLAQFLIDGGLPPQRSEEGEALLRKVANTGDTNARGILSIRLIEGNGLPKNIEEGEQLLRQLAEDGDRQAMAFLGEYLIEGNKLSKNTSEGEIWLIKSAELGWVNAMIDLGDRYLSGEGLVKKKVEGVKWLRKAIETGSTKAMAILGDHILDNNTLVRDMNEGRQWLERSANSGHVSAMIDLGERLINGNNVDRDVKEGERWLRKAVETGDTEAMTTLGNKLCNGEGLAQNPQEGERLLKQASSLGDAYAPNLLGIRYYRSRAFTEAVNNFLQGFQRGEMDSGVNLVYMARRSELPPGFDLPPVPTLLEESLTQNDAFGVINYALCLASGFHYNLDWAAADRAIASLVNSENDRMPDALNWWHKEIIPPNDPEGHLVVGWLVRHRLVRDPDGISVARRMDYARQNGWDVPDWMDKDVLST